MTHKYFSMDTPPKKGQKFALFTKKNRVIIIECMTEFEAKRDEILQGEEILGWRHVDVNNTPPPFLQTHFQKQIEK